MRDLINTYMYLHARIKHLLAQPAGAPLSQLAGPSRSGSDKGKQRAEVWDGFAFSVPSFHSTVFWECEYLCKMGLTYQGKRLSSTTSLSC